MVVASAPGSLVAGPPVGEPLVAGSPVAGSPVEEPLVGDTDAIALRPARPSALARGGPAAADTIATEASNVPGTVTELPPGTAESPCPHALVADTTARAARHASKQRRLERMTAAISPVQAADPVVTAKLFPALPFSALSFTALPFTASMPTIAPDDAEPGEICATPGTTTAGQLFQCPPHPKRRDRAVLTSQPNSANG